MFLKKTEVSACAAEAYEAQPTEVTAEQSNCRPASGSATACTVPAEPARYCAETAL